MIALYLPNKIDKPKVEFLTVEETAKKCGRSRHAFLKLIARGILPDANFRTAPKVVKRGDKIGDVIKGYRLYSKDYLVPKLIVLFRSIKQGRAITMGQKKALADAFVYEKQFLENEY